MFTTLNRIQAQQTNVADLAKVHSLVPRRGTNVQDAPISLAHILDLMGSEFCLWCLRNADGCAQLNHEFCSWCIDEIVRYCGPGSPKYISEAVPILQKMIAGTADEDELRGVRSSAWAIARMHYVIASIAYAAGSRRNACRNAIRQQHADKLRELILKYSVQSAECSV